MTTTKIILITAAAGVLWYAAARAIDGSAPAMSCCSDMASCTGMAGAQANTAAATAVDSPALTAPVKSVFDQYLKIQADLANDSLTGVAENANAISKAFQGDAKTLPADVGTSAEALAKAKDLKTARTAFKPLSDALIKYVADNKAKDAYVQVYCPMVRASWLQADKNVNNPYMGKAMASCGEIKE